MEVFEAIKKRRSIRKFDSTKEVTDEQIEKLLEAARWAPSAGNLQSWFFVIVRDEDIKEEIVKATRGQDFIAQAPLAMAGEVKNFMPSKMQLLLLKIFGWQLQKWG